LTKKLYIPETADTIEINGDVDPRGGVMSQSRSVTMPSDKITDKITPTSDKINPKPRGISIIKISDLERMADAQKDI
jgi:hypothetical protein